MKFATKLMQRHPPHLRHVATLPWEIENSNFWPPVNCACVQQRFKQLINTTLCPAFLRKFVCQPVCCVALQIQTFINILSSSLNTMLIVDKHCSDICCTNFWCHKLIAKVNYQKNSDMKNFNCNQYMERHPILGTENINIYEHITKLEAITMQYTCTFFHVG